MFDCVCRGTIKHHSLYGKSSTYPHWETIIPILDLTIFSLRKYFKIPLLFNFELMGNKTLELAYFVIMIAFQDFFIHISNDNELFS